MRRTSIGNMKKEMFFTVILKEHLQKWQ